MNQITDDIADEQAAGQVAAKDTGADDSHPHRSRK
jgi:hypothetical protein